VARRLGIADEVPLPWIAIVCTALATLLVANVIAAFPANRAARTSPASALRAE
jgi:ABC-type antimicrobial peptide transport system permease subunit